MIPYPQFKVRFNEYKGEKIPFFFSEPGDIYNVGVNSAEIGKDIIASAFYLLSCWQEHINLGNSNPDIRFDYKQSMQYKWDFTETPVVDAYCDILDIILDLIKPEYNQNKIWKDNKDFCVSLSHDIDYWDVWAKEHYKKVCSYNLHRLGKHLTRSTYKFIAHSLTKANFNPVKAMNKIINLETKLGAKSTSFLLVQEDSEDSRRSYFLDNKYKEQVLNVFKDRDIGLHGSPRSAYEFKDAIKEKQRIDKAFPQAKGYRSHKLSFEYQRTFNLLSEMEFKYDSSLGYWENIGFRAGISYPFYPFDIKNNRPFPILEIPLIVMDTSMLSAKGMNLSAMSSGIRLKELLDRAKKFNSHISLLWHNNTFDSVDYPFWKSLYINTIRYAKKNNACVMSIDELNDYWVEKNSKEI